MARAAGSLAMAVVHGPRSDASGQQLQIMQQHSINIATSTLLLTGTDGGHNVVFYSVANFISMGGLKLILFGVTPVALMQYFGATIFHLLMPLRLDRSGVTPHLGVSALW
jgi:hypothetical protein